MKKNLRPVTFTLPQIDEYAQMTFVMVPKDQAEHLHKVICSELLKDSPKDKDSAIDYTYGMCYNEEEKVYEIIKIAFNGKTKEAFVVEKTKASNMKNRAKVQFKIALAKNGVI